MKTKGGMWCDTCQMPVAGQKGTHRARGTFGILAAPLTGGVSLIATAPGEYHCPNCGQPVRRAKRSDLQAPPQATTAAAPQAIPQLPSYDPRAAGASLFIKLPPGTIQPRHYNILNEALGLMGIVGAEAGRQWGTSLPKRMGPFSLETARAIKAKLELAGYPVTEIPHPPEGEKGAIPSPTGPSTVAELAELAKLRESGALTEAEFATLKSRIIGDTSS